MSTPIFQKKMQVGLGEAVRRVNKLNDRIVRGLANQDQVSEHDLLMDALNEVKIDLGFDCDEDGIPDTIEIFAKTASTSCCRLVEFTPAPSRARKTSSRRKKTTKSSRTKK
tara:strand:+ start:250 stop:582 length:333 start_codon:yes stop_codon:yes gene_type:complete